MRAQIAFAGWTCILRYGENLPDEFRDPGDRFRLSDDLRMTIVTYNGVDFVMTPGKNGVPVWRSVVVGLDGGLITTEDRLPSVTLSSTAEEVVKAWKPTLEGLKHPTFEEILDRG